MSFFTPGSKAIASTAAPASNPSTSALIAEVDSTQLLDVKQQNVQVSWIVGCSTANTLQLEHCLSTGLGSTAIRDVTYVLVPKDQSGQYMTKHYVTAGDRFRVRTNVALASANAMAKILVEPLD